MVSKWESLKKNALHLRRQGQSIGHIENKLGIPRSTLSGWFRHVTLTPTQKQRLRENWKIGLVAARKKAVAWHNGQKEERLRIAKDKALAVLDQIDSSDEYVLELALAVLYLAEGSKKNIETAMGSSDPRTLRFFVAALSKLFDFDRSKIRCELYLRADHDPGQIKRYWAKELGLPLANFKQVNVDMRTAGKKTYPNYKGVCGLRCGNVAIRRRLVYLAEAFFDRIASSTSG